MTPTFSQSGLRWLWLSLLVIVLDRATKLIVLNHFDVMEVLRITPFFNLTLTFNRGAAFSFLSAGSGWQVWIFGAIAMVISIVLIFWLRKIFYRQTWLAAAISLVIGGALGNLSDRIHYGYVIDFLQFHWGSLYYPVFNLADSCICVGAFMLVLDSLLSTRRKRQEIK
jgi:signal peptidase II